MSWNHPFVLALIPPALGMVWWTFRLPNGAGDGARYANIRRLWAGRRGLSERRATTGRRAHGLVLALGTLAALLALARPQWGTVEEKSYDHAREVLLALDLSRSMLADDVSPTRLARAKLLIESLLDQLRGERVGLVVFAGTAFVQSPLSADYEVLRDLLSALDPSYLPQDGTDYHAMLNAATQAFGQTGDGDRFLIVLSDGEAHDEEWKSFIPTLRERGIRVIGLGVGTPQGALLPDGAGGFLKDEQGAAVLSRLEPHTLQEIATQTGGAYRDAATWVDIAELVNATVEQGKKGKYVEQKNVHLRDQYQRFLAPALLLFLFSYWLEFPVFPVARALGRRNRPSHTAAPVAAIAAALLVLIAWRMPRAAAAAEAPPSSLQTIVADLVAKPQLGAGDYARLATETVSFASQPGAANGTARTGVIDDALSGVDRGEHLDAKAADWPALRQRLEQLKQPKKEPPKQDQQQQQQQQQNQGGGGQDQQQQSGGGQQEDTQHKQQGAHTGNSGHQGQRGDQAQNESQKNSENQQNAQNGQPDSKSADASQNNAHTDAQHSGLPDAQQAENKDHDQAGGGGSGEKKPDEAQQADDSPRPDSPATDRQEAAASAPQPVTPGKTKPLKEADAGFGELKPEDQQSTAAGTETEAKPPTRMVGGGRALQGVPQGDLALADAVGKMERVKDGDSPAVLFDRMNQAEGPRRQEKHGKNW